MENSAEAPKQIGAAPKADAIKASLAYRIIKVIATLMDRYYLDAVIGFAPVVGDTISLAASLPFLYVCLFKVRSIPLSLAVLSNMLIDFAIGLVPLWIGNILDFFYCSNLINFRLITGYVEGDEAVINEVKERSRWVIVLILGLLLIIALLLFLIYKCFEWGLGLFC